MRKQTTAFILLTLITFSGAAFAQDGGKKGGRQGGHQGPPPEAVAACSGQQAGAACQFEDREGEAKAGTCFSPDGERALMCRPSDAPQKGEGGHRGAPPEAVEACSGQQAGAACQFEDREGEAKAGTCFSPDAEHPVACRPSDAPQQGGQRSKAR